jgi:hypothetical protein
MMRMKYIWHIFKETQGIYSRKDLLMMRRLSPGFRETGTMILKLVDIFTDD